MNWERIGLVTALLATSAVNTGLACYAWRKWEKNVKEFAMLMMVLTLYSFGYAGELSSNTLGQALFWSNAEYFGIPFIPFCWLLFTANYVEWHSRLRRRLMAVTLGISISTFLIQHTQAYHNWYYINPQLVSYNQLMILHFGKGIWYHIYWVYSFFICIVGLLLFVQMRRLAQPIYRKQIGIIILASLIPLLCNLFYSLNLGVPGLDLSPFGFTATGVLYVLGFSKFRLFDFKPIARERIFENIRDGVLVLDNENRLIDYNPAARALLPELQQQTIGGEASVVLYHYTELQRQIFNNIEQIEFSYRCQSSGADWRWVESRLTVIDVQPGRNVGKMIIISDVTQAKQALAQLIQSEKIAVLGRLVANAAHEMNSPLAAIKATADNMAQSLEQFWGQIPEDYCDELTSTDRELLVGLLVKLHHSPGLTTREERLEFQKLLETLQGEISPEIIAVAHHFVKAGVAGEFLTFLPFCQERRKLKLLRLCLALAAQRRDIVRILQAEAKTARLVYALNCYSHDSHGGGPTPTDLRSGIDTVLQIYEGILKNGIKTSLNLQAVPPIMARPDELQQVWTNLIHNAVQAMRGNGELQIDMEEDETTVSIHFTDNGPGIAPEILPRIFEPFFTTKAMGEGSGLGLAICQEIVTRHRGTITVQSKPGRTRFTVILPKQGGEQ